MWVGVGMELAGAVGVLALLGWGVDQWLGTKPWGLLTGGSIGIVGGMYNLIKQAIKANR
jgi:ATP synthase protein I